MIIQVLQILKTATNALSSGKLPTASLILPLKHSIVTQMNSLGADRSDAVDSDDAHAVEVAPVVHECKMAIKHDLEKRYVIAKDRK